MTTLAEFYGDQKLVDDMTEFIQHFIESRFSFGNETEEQQDKLKAIIADVLMEGFVAGAQWAENANGINAESKILVAPNGSLPKGGNA